MTSNKRESQFKRTFAKGDQEENKILFCPHFKIPGVRSHLKDFLYRILPRFLEMKWRGMIQNIILLEVIRKMGRCDLNLYLFSTKINYNFNFSLSLSDFSLQFLAHFSIFFVFIIQFFPINYSSSQLNLTAPPLLPSTSFILLLLIYIKNTQRVEIFVFSLPLSLSPKEHHLLIWIWGKSPF